jgi:hypothetical protein
MVMLEMSIKQLLRAEDCISAVFPSEASRPSLRTFKGWQAKGWIPFHKIGKLSFYDPEQVRAALDRRFAVAAQA